ncbi:hypothetical protein E4U46_000521 [Claviceps purpurea]|nr:hypothetical protein E4U46_000521 [Claviceps purpurea]
MFCSSLADDANREIMLEAPGTRAPFPTWDERLNELNSRPLAYPTHGHEGDHPRRHMRNSPDLGRRASTSTSLAPSPSPATASTNDDDAFLAAPADTVYTGKIDPAARFDQVHKPA